MRRYWESWGAWWSGDLTALKTYAPLTAPGGYWARRAAAINDGDREIHLPLAADIARTSAGLVAGDTPVMNWENDTAVQNPWDAASQKFGWSNRLLEMEEIRAATGGAYLRPAWDTRLAKHPLLTVVRADEALPTFRFGMLASVTFVQVLPAPDGWKTIESGEKWRHLEHHEPGQIRNELWLGNTGSIGRPLPLSDHPTTMDLLPTINTVPIRADGGLLAEYIPNDLPQPLDMLPLGRSDFQGIEPMLDGLDTAWDSWMRDIDDGVNRILLSGEMLEPVGRTSSGGFLSKVLGNTQPVKGFDRSKRVFTPLNIPAEDGGKVSPITQVQFKIRVDEHERTTAALFDEIVSRAGYAPQTFGKHVEGQLSGTAMRRREQRSYSTRNRKRRYARPPLERVAETLMLINNAVFGGPKPAGTPTLEWRETDQADPKEAAETLELLDRARAISTEVKVRMAHPEWDKTQVSDEVVRLEKQHAAEQAPPMTGFEPIHPPAQQPPSGG
jgi:hypothetical protein